MTTIRVGWTYSTRSADGEDHRVSIKSTLYNDGVVLATAFELDRGSYHFDPYVYGCYGICTSWRGEIVRKGSAYSNRVEWHLLNDATRTLAICSTRREALETAGNLAIAAFNREVVAANAARTKRDWVAIVHEARASRTAAVKARGPQAASLSFLAQDYGIVPHAESTDCKGCPAWAEANRKAAALINWEFRHPWASPDRQHLTAYETVIRA